MGRGLGFAQRSLLANWVQDLQQGYDANPLELPFLARQYWPRGIAVGDLRELRCWHPSLGKSIISDCRSGLLSLERRGLTINSGFIVGGSLREASGKISTYGELRAANLWWLTGAGIEEGAYWLAHAELPTRAQRYHRRAKDTDDRLRREREAEEAARRREWDRHLQSAQRRTATRTGR